MARASDTSVMPPIGLPPILSALCRAMGCGSCLRRRREGRSGSRSPASSRYQVSGGGASPPEQTGPRILARALGQPQPPPGSPSVRILGARSSSGQHPDEATAALLPNKGLDPCFSCSPELPKPTPPKGFKFIDDSDLDEDHCPTCLEQYTPDNPQISTRCGHHFHLSCIYEWLQRSESCPVCSKPMRDTAGHRFL